MFGWFDRSASKGILPIGLDVGAAQVKAVQLRQTERREAELVAATAGPGAGTAHAAGVAALDGYFRETVRPLLDRGGFSGRRVVMALPSAHTHATRLRLPAFPDESTVRETIQQHAADWLPFPARRALIRHIDAGEVYDGDGGARREVLALAIRRDIVERYLDAAGAARLEVTSVVPDPLALLCALEGSDGAPVRMVIDLGHAAARAYVAEGRRLIFARIPAAAAGGGAAHLAAQLRFCRAYVDATFPARAVQEVVFTGGRAHDRGLCRTLAEAIGLPARLAKPKAALAAGLSLAAAEPAVAPAVAPTAA
jgi:Tfp pilus assembly PilM family ATPase